MREWDNLNSWSKIWLRVDLETSSIDLIVTFESNGEKKLRNRFFLRQRHRRRWRHRRRRQQRLQQWLRLQSHFYCFCLADTVAMSLSFSLSITATMPQPFPVSICHCVCGWERQCEEENERVRERVNWSALERGNTISFCYGMAMGYRCAAALIRLGGSKFSSQNIQKWFFLLFIFWPQSSGQCSIANINIITIINNFALVCERESVCVCV